MFLYLNYPSWIHPEIIPGFGILRWYGLMYLVAFAVAFILFRRQAKEGLLGEKVSDDDIYGFFWWGIVGLILGARIFSTLVYEPTGKYWRAPWLIFWPFDENMRWTGLQGMSYHGGFIGGVLGVLLWCIKHKKNFFKWGNGLIYWNDYRYWEFPLSGSKCRNFSFSWCFAKLWCGYRMD